MPGRTEIDHCRPGGILPVQRRAVEPGQHTRIGTVGQAKLADDLGYGCWWQVEHHGAGEFSLSSAPESMLAAISQHTSRIRLGHSPASVVPARG